MLERILKGKGRLYMLFVVVVAVAVIGAGCNSPSKAERNQATPAGASSVDQRTGAETGATVGQTATGKKPAESMPMQGSAEGAATPALGTGSAGSPVSTPGVEPAAMMADVSYTLLTHVGEGKLVFVGKGGQIDGQTNPTLTAQPGQVVQVTLINGDGAEHDATFPDFNAATNRITGKDASSTTVFRVEKAGEYAYFCSVPGHRAAGMEGKFLVGAGEVATTATAPSVARDPSDLPGPIEDRGPQHLSFELETVELKGQLADGTVFTYWTFGGKVPGPFLRVRVGDTIDVRLKNSETSRMIHSIDLHAVTGQGGGAQFSQTAPGQQTGFTFKALNPGLYVYHCATPMVAEHIANGMYGLILVEPEGGLPRVDHEYYVMQGEIYSRQALGQHGELEFSVEKLLNEQPEYYVFNGTTTGLSKEFPMKAKAGETVRIFFGDAGPNHTSSLHLIGEILDRVYDQASLTAAPLTDVQTTLVPAGGATMVEFKVDVPGRYVLVDHALARLERGLVGYLIVDGSPTSEIYSKLGE